MAAARKTASAYERILRSADAPDAAVAHGSPLDDAVRSLQTIPGITDQRAYAGFRGVVDGIDPALTSGLLAPTGDRFPLELPCCAAGRLPDPEAPDEVFVSATVADGAGLEVGDRLSFHLFTPNSERTAETTVTVTGIGTMPVEAVSDETAVVGIAVFTACVLRRPSRPRRVLGEQRRPGGRGRRARRPRTRRRFARSRPPVGAQSGDRRDQRGDAPAGDRARRARSCRLRRHRHRSRPGDPAQPRPRACGQGDPAGARDGALTAARRRDGHVGGRRRRRRRDRPRCDAAGLSDRAGRARCTTSIRRPDGRSKRRSL